MRADVASDGVFEIGHGFEDGAVYFAPADDQQEIFDCFEARCQCVYEMECPSRIFGEPGQDIGLFGGLYIRDGMDELSGAHCSLYSFQGLDELLMALPCHVTPDNAFIQDFGRGGGVLLNVLAPFFCALVAVSFSR